MGDWSVDRVGYRSVEGEIENYFTNSAKYVNLLSGICNNSKNQKCWTKRYSIGHNFLYFLKKKTVTVFSKTERRGGGGCKF